MKILVPLDGSTTDHLALTTAVHLSKKLRYYVMAMFVNIAGEYSPELTRYGSIKAMVDTELQKKGQTVLDSAFSTGKTLGCQIEGIISYGVADTEIVDYVNEHGVVKLVVMGGPSSEIGVEICKNIIIGLRVPVFIVNKETEIKNILVAVNNSESSRRAAAYAALLSAKTSADITLINVIPNTATILMNYGYFSEAPSMEKRIAQLEQYFSDRASGTLSATLKGINVPAQCIIREGDAPYELIRAASEFDLLVLGVSNSSETYKMGNVSSKILRNKQVNILCVQ
ncbi:MAG: universal stress protein [Nitrospirae bacterium]|nr:universal stress protein [Nitrospirota bacterium]MBF0536118.1 universal stress protein [Nitrospirota bacterium]MBF0616854.1 universal stress protein [Nitrospirota bacterium]